MRYLLTILIIALALPAVAANRDLPSDMRVLDDANITRHSLERYESDCLLGNPAAPLGVVADWYYGHETYTTPVAPGQDGCCAEGFVLTSVSFLIDFGVEDVPSTFYVRAGLRGSVDNGGGCYQPSDELYSSPTYVVTLTKASLYEFEIPIEPVDADCVMDAGPYFAFVEFPEWFEDGKNPDAIVDDKTELCTNWYDFYGLGWEDLLVDYGFTGNLVMWADAVCCQEGVSNEDASWSGVKQYFR